MRARPANEISAILKAAGHIDEARELLERLDGYSNYREHLKTLADELADTAVDEKVKPSNDLMQNHGRE